jgi:hypothetical protein
LQVALIDRTQYEIARRYGINACGTSTGAADTGASVARFFEADD